MPANECIPYMEPADRFTAQALTAVSGKRFVMITGNRTSGPLIPGSPSVGASDPTEGGNYQVGHAANGGRSVGVSTWDAAIGEKVGVITRGIVPIAASTATIAFGSPIASDANGKGKLATAITDMVLGILMTVGGAIDSDLEVLLTLSNAPVQAGT